MQSTLGHIIRAVAAMALALWLVGYAATPNVVQAAGSISVSPTSGAPGTSVTVTGSGFSSNETGVAVTYDGTSVASSITTNPQGGWTATFVVPVSPSGSRTIAASGQVTQAVNTTFTVIPDMSINRTTGAPGSSVTVTGNGFSASETGIAVTYDGRSVASGITANSQGSWSATFVVPASSSGSHSIDASGSSTSATSVSDEAFTVTPSIAINRTTGAPGSSVTVTGAGFDASEMGITVTYDGRPVTSGITANSQGSWSATFVVPASSSGSHSIAASGSSTSATTADNIAFNTTAGISMNPTTGAPGSSVTVTGAGFGAGETGVTVTYDGKPVASGITANSQGGWSSTFVIPASSSGSHTITASGSSTSAASISDLTFTIAAVVSINRPNGVPGDSVTVTGYGYGASETSIVVTYDGTPIASGISANPQGGWNIAFTIPESAAGSHTIGAYGSVTRIGTISEATLNIRPGIAISPAFGSVGETVDIAGAGFASRSPLKFSYDNREILLEGGATADDSGSFNRSITIPRSRRGTHTIKVEDSQRNASNGDFTMENTPPAVPRLLSPQDGARLGILGGIRPTLKWSSITDPSGVTFVLQIDTTPHFTQPILEKAGILGNQYTLVAADALPRDEYYWRIKAVDGASNEGVWSEPQLLKSGLMPPWGLFTTIVLIVAAIGAIVYFFLVRVLWRRREAIPVPQVEMPQVFASRLRLIEPEAPSRSLPLPRRLALPQPAKRGKTIPAEEMAHLKVILDFAQSLPLVEPGYTADWLVDLLQTSMGIEISASVYEHLLKGELQVRYEPEWMSHPSYQSLTTLLQGQAVLQDLNAFVDSVNRCASEATLLLQDIYRDATAEIPSDFLKRGGWVFVCAVYSDALSWLLGKSLRSPSERDYIVKAGEVAGEETGTFSLWGEETTSFAGPLIEELDEQEASQSKALHLRLRRTYRNSDRARRLLGMMTQVEVQRQRLVNAFSQLGRITQQIS